MVKAALSPLSCTMAQLVEVQAVPSSASPSVSHCSECRPDSRPGCLQPVVAQLLYSNLIPKAYLHMFARVRSSATSGLGLPGPRCQEQNDLRT